MEANKELFITHLFDASPDLVFKAWTDPAHLIHWYAPEGCTIAFKSIDVRIGGKFHSVINDPVHGDCWIIGTYQQIKAPEKLVFSMVLSNEHGDMVSANAAGKSDKWPEAILTTVIFTAVGKQTKVTLHQTVDETEAKKTGAYQSWFSMFNKLQEALAANK